MPLISYKQKERLIKEHLSVQAILNALPVKRECESCEFWDDMCNNFGAVPPDDVRAVGCDNWIEKDFIPF